MLAAFTERLQKNFPGRFQEEKKEIFQGTLFFQPSSHPKHKSQVACVGHRYDSKDGRHVVQARTDGYTFNWLKPYEDWESLRREAYGAWQVYRDSLPPEIITRIAIRFINQIELPGPIIDFDDYFTAAPPIPKDLPQVYAGFLSRLAIPFDDGRVMASLTQSFQPHINPSVVPVIMDIEVTNTVMLESQSEGSDRITWEAMDSLRAIKNKVFFESITEKLAGLLE